MSRKRSRTRLMSDMLHRRGLTLPGWSAKLTSREYVNEAALANPSNRFERRKGDALRRSRAKEKERNPQGSRSNEFTTLSPFAEK